MGSEARADAGKHHVTEGKSLAPVHCWAGVAAASADRELATDACLGIAQRELPPPPLK